MAGPLDDEIDGQTPLTGEEHEDLIPSYITLRSELNEAEQANILEAQEWAFKRKRNVLNEKFLNDLHKHMYGNVWRWGGKYRRTGKNIGVDAYRIPTELRQLIDDCTFWIENKTYEPDELAARFHHKLVWVHAYPNGNGRHARFATDLLLMSLGLEPFTWGSVNLVDPSETRRRYIDALRDADNHNIEPLLAFARC